MTILNELEVLSIPLIEWIGYFASLLVLISLSVSSMLRLRLINLFGAALFSFYGFYIGSYPVGLMNMIIVVFNLYYLQQLYFRKDTFEIVETTADDPFVRKMIDHYRHDIRKFFPQFSQPANTTQVALAIIRNMNLAGLFLGEKNGDCLNVQLDYVVPQFRDYKNGAFIFDHFRKSLKARHYSCIMACTSVNHQIKYLKKMGFTAHGTHKGQPCFKLVL